MRLVHSRVGILIFALLFAMIVEPALAQTPAQNFTLKPRQVATVSFQGFCVEFGGTFPSSIELLSRPVGVASNPVRSAIAYVQANNIAADGAKALEAQYAIWAAQGYSGMPLTGATASAVFNASKNAPPANPPGTSVVDARNAGTARVTIRSWNPVGSPVRIFDATDYFYGQGTMTVENISNQDLTLFVPTGMRIDAAYVGYQDIVAYQTGVSVGAVPSLPNTASGESLLALSALAGCGFVAMHMLRRRRGLRV